jgi:hypothetical protein
MEAAIDQRKYSNVKDKSHSEFLTITQGLLGFLPGFNTSFQVGDVRIAHLL